MLRCQREKQQKSKLQHIQTRWFVDTTAYYRSLLFWEPDIKLTRQYDFTEVRNISTIEGNFDETFLGTMDLLMGSKGEKVKYSRNQGHLPSPLPLPTLEGPRKNLPNRFKTKTKV